MYLKKMMFLGLTLVLTAGLIQAMARTDAEILDSVETVAYKDLGVFKSLSTQLADGSKWTLIRGRNNGIFIGVNSIIQNNFITPEAKQNAWDSVLKKYQEQDPSYKLTQ